MLSYSGFSRRAKAPTDGVKKQLIFIPICPFSVPQDLSDMVSAVAHPLVISGEAIKLISCWRRCPWIVKTAPVVLYQQAIGIIFSLYFAFIIFSGVSMRMFWSCFTFWRVLGSIQYCGTEWPNHLSRLHGCMYPATNFYIRIDTNFHASFGR